MAISAKLFFIFAFLFATGISYAQKFTYPVIQSSGKTLTEFIPSKWFIKDSAQGDLNGDKAAEIAAVLEYKDTIMEPRPDGYKNEGAPRILIILLKNKTSHYNLLLQNNTFITRYGEGGMSADAYGDISISAGVLQIFVEFTRGHATYKFRMKNNDLYLTGATNNGVSGGIFNGFDVNFLTKKAKIQKGKIDENKTKVKWINVPVKQLKRLRDLKMIMLWEVVPYQYI
jgi:hypothetical protein